MIIISKSWVNEISQVKQWRADVLRFPEPTRFVDARGRANTYISFCPQENLHFPKNFQTQKNPGSKC